MEITLRAPLTDTKTKEQFRPAIVPIEYNNIERTTNRFAANTGTVYDDAGNVVSDDKFREMDFVYDANGRMAKAIKANFPEALSVFDAGGNKVATRVNDVWRFQIYDAGGKCVAEYGGSQSADDGGVKYTHQDIQGSTRTISTQAGFAQARMDYQAFGEQISSSIGQRTATGYAATDTLRNRYALTERDEATGLDDTWFRKLENRGGRWTSPDPYNGSANIGNGQSWNRYSYVENQPTNYVDPSGLLALSWVCWDLNTYFSNANGDQLTRTTTQCSAIWVGGGDGGGDGGIDVGGGGGAAVDPPNNGTGPCARMAARAQKIANKYFGNGTVKDFEKEFTALYLGMSLDSWISAGKLNYSGGTNSSSASEHGQSDFKPEFWQGSNPNSDQVHHFAAYFSGGINGQWTATAIHKALDDNSGDKLLGDAAYEIGASLVPWEAGGPGGIGMNRLRKIGQTIREKICDLTTKAAGREAN